MSRRQKKQRKTVLIYCEGLHDAMFIKHLHKLYGQDNPHTQFVIKAGAGGAPVSIVQKAAKVLGDFNLRIAKFDNDKGRRALRAAYDASGSIKIAHCTPAIEGTMLEILEPNRAYRNHATQTCKKRLHGRYLSASDRSDPHKYESVFPRELLDAARTRHDRLNRIIEIFEHGIEWTGFDRDDTAI